MHLAPREHAVDRFPERTARKAASRPSARRAWNVERLLRNVGLLFLFPAVAAPAATLCVPTETVAFSCSLGASRTVSMCLAKSEGRGSPRLSYRFARAGTTTFVFPESATDLLGRFRYAHYFRSQVDRTEVSFTNADATYAVFDYYEGEGQPSYARGVRVTVGGQDRELRCTGAVVSRLEQLESLLPCDTDNALSSCR